MTARGRAVHEPAPHGAAAIGDVLAELAGLDVLPPVVAARVFLAHLSDVERVAVVAELADGIRHRRTVTNPGVVANVTGRAA